MSQLDHLASRFVLKVDVLKDESRIKGVLTNRERRFNGMLKKKIAQRGVSQALF